MVGREGLEPSTNRLKAYCSTIELTAQNRAKYLNRSRRHTQAELPPRANYIKNNNLGAIMAVNRPRQARAWPLCTAIPAPRASGWPDPEFSAARALPPGGRARRTCGCSGAV